MPSGERARILDFGNSLARVSLTLLGAAGDPNRPRAYNGAATEPNHRTRSRRENVAMNYLLVTAPIRIVAAGKFVRQDLEDAVQNGAQNRVSSRIVRIDVYLHLSGLNIGVDLNRIRQAG